MRLPSVPSMDERTVNSILCWGMILFIIPAVILPLAQYANVHRSQVVKGEEDVSFSYLTQNAATERDYRGRIRNWPEVLQREHDEISLLLDPTEELQLWPDRLEYWESIYPEKTSQWGLRLYGTTITSLDEFYKWHHILTDRYGESELQIPYPFDEYVHTASANYWMIRNGIKYRVRLRYGPWYVMSLKWEPEEVVTEEPSGHNKPWLAQEESEPNPNYSSDGWPAFLTIENEILSRILDPSGERKLYPDYLNATRVETPTSVMIYGWKDSTRDVFDEYHSTLWKRYKCTSYKWEPKGGYCQIWGRAEYDGHGLSVELTYDNAHFIFIHFWKH